MRAALFVTVYLVLQGAILGADWHFRDRWDGRAQRRWDAGVLMVLVGVVGAVMLAFLVTA